MNELKDCACSFSFHVTFPEGNRRQKIAAGFHFTLWVSLPCISVTVAFSAEDQSHNWKAHFT